MARLATPAQRHARFVEDKQFAVLDRVLRSSGTLAYARPTHLDKITLEPALERLTVDGDRLVIDTGEAPRVIELDSQPEIRALVDTIRGALSGDLTTLQRNYRIEASGTLESWRLVLHPTSPVVAQLVRTVVITGDRDVRSIESLQANGDTDRLTITPEP